MSNGDNVSYELKYRVAEVQRLMLKEAYVRVNNELEKMRDQRDWWSRVARHAVRSIVLARVCSRTLTRGVSTRQRGVDELRRLTSALADFDRSDLQERFGPMEDFDSGA